LRLALVFNPFAYKLHEENLRVVQRFFGLFPPLSLCWVAGIAERAGHEVTLIDARTLKLTPPQVVAQLRRFRPDLIGFMMTTYMFRETLTWARFIKNELKTPIIFGGYNLRVYPKESLMNDVADFGCVNSALLTVPRLLAELSDGRRFESVPGLVFKRDGEIVQTASPETEERFADYPMPWRRGLPHELYEEFPTERKNFTVMVTSKGCPRTCTFCEAGGTLYNPRTPEQVVDEMELCRREYGIREIDIFDYEFSINRKRTVAICDEIVRRKLDILWACRARIDSVDEEVLRKMRAAGCGRIYYGIESGVQTILDVVNKGITLEQIRATIHETKAQGIRPLGFFLVGSPGETKETFDQTMRFAKGLKLDYIQFSKLTAKPLTSMWRELVKQTGHDYWKEYILGQTEEQALPRPWVNFSNDQIDHLTKWAYIRFHARPGFLLRHTLKVRSWGEFKRKVRGFFEMLFKQEEHGEDWFKKNEPFEAYNPYLKS
jgi:radical SAM superfamily enzyme YgiQ (UPF0313 family)